MERRSTFIAMASSAGKCWQRLLLVPLKRRPCGPLWYRLMDFFTVSLNMTNHFGLQVALKEHRPDVNKIGPIPNRDEWIALMCDCWQPRAQNRPSFKEIIERLQMMGL
jgi:hypothetical protein